MSHTSQQSTTVANALSGEKSFERVEYAVTGETVSSLISGISAVLKNHPIGNKFAALMFSMLSDMYNERHKLEESLSRSGMGVGSNTPYVENIPGPWNTLTPYQNTPQAQRDTIAMQELLKKYSQSSQQSVVSACP